MVHGAVVLGEQGEYESGVVQIVVVGKAPNGKRKVKVPIKKTTMLNFIGTTKSDLIVNSRLLPIQG